MADDLVDDSSTKAAALDWINKLSGYLDLVYSSGKVARPSNREVGEYIRANFPAPTHSAFELLPTHLLPREPLYELLEIKERLVGRHQDPN